MTGRALGECDEFVVGRRREQLVLSEITRTQIVQYAGASGDYSPLHTDEPHAVCAGYRGVMAHGMLAMAATERVLADWVGRDRLVRFGARFVSPVWPGDSLCAAATVKAVRDEPEARYVDLDIVTTNQDGETVLSGSACARI